MFGSFRSGFTPAEKMKVCLLILVGITAYRCIGGFINPLPFQIDEAQYVGWSHFISFGYYSKPPFIAWAVASGQQLCSILEIVNTEGCARFLQPIAFMVAAFGVAGTAYRLTRSADCAMAASLIFISTPLSGFYSLFVTTDAWLLMFWSLALWALVLALQSRSTSIWLWLLCGILAGLGLLSKYSMAAFFLSAFCYFFVAGRLKRVGPWVGVAAALVVFSPNIFWNYANGFPTIGHHLEISQISANHINHQSAGDRIASAADFLLAQFGLFGPLLFVVMLLTLRAKKSPDPSVTEHASASIVANKELILLHLMTWVILGLAVIQAFSSRSFANWAAPAYVSGSILAAHALVYCSDRVTCFSAKFILGFSLITGLIASTLLIHGPKALFLKTGEETYRVRAIEKLRGWRELALGLREWVAHESQSGSKWTLLAEDRRILAALASYGHPDIETPFAWNPENRRDNHYNWFLDIRNQVYPNGMRFMLIRLSRSGDTSLSLPKTSGWQVLRRMDLARLESLQVGVDGEQIVAFEIARVP